MTSEQWQLLYNDGIFPALREVLPHDLLKEYPLNYNLASSTSRNASGAWVFRTHTIPREHTRRFLDVLRELVNNDEDLSGFRDFFYHVHTKNTKVVMRSSVVDPLSALEERFDQFHWNELDPTKLFLDIGMEFHPDGATPTTFLWDMEFCKKYLRALGFQKMNRHSWCTSAGVGGANGVHNKLRDEMLFCQLYMCEKNVLYTYGSGGVKGFCVQDVVNEANRFTLCTKTMLSAFNASRNKSFGVRVEWRVAFTSATDILRNVSEADWKSFVGQGNIYAVPTELVCRWKSAMVTSLIDFWSFFKAGTQQQTLQTLVAAYVMVLIKGMVSCPEPKIFGSTSTALKLRDGMKAHNWASTSLINVATRSVTCSDPSVPALERSIRRIRSIPSRQREIGRREARFPQSRDDFAEGRPWSSSFTAENIMAEMVADLWSLFPSPASNGKNMEDNIPPSFSWQYVTEHVAFPYLVSSTTYTWNDRFNMFFPLSPSDVRFGPKSQGWSRLSYYPTYFRWLEANPRGRDALWALFKDFDCIVGFGLNDKLWKTGKAPRRVGTWVFFHRNPSKSRH